jgi:hypothetical protein
MARSLHDYGAHVAILDHNMTNAGLLAEELNDRKIKISLGQFIVIFLTVIQIE